MLKKIRETNELVKLELTHSFGHVQIFTKKRSIEHLFDGLSVHPCPGCYDWIEKPEGEKEKSPNRLAHRLPS